MIDPCTASTGRASFPATDHPQTNMTNLMRTLLRSVAFVAPILLAAGCTDSTPVSPVSPLAQRVNVTASLSEVRISEFHYDNAGTDAGEAIEVSGPAGTDLTGWQIVLYNGNGGAVYHTRTLSGVIPASCTTRGVLVFTYPVDGIQNGSPDGIALVDGGGALVEFLSYEGVFAAVGGPANGLPATDVGVSETATTPVGNSLSRNGSGVWSAPAPNTFGSCNDEGGPPPPEVAHVIVSPAAATIGVGATQQFTATATDAADQPIPGVTFAWSSTMPSVAAVNAGGLATGVTPGDASIVATAPNGIADSAELHVDAVTPPGLPDTRFSEIHYDNFATDVGEAIEVEGPGGTDLTGWSVVLYNGNGGVTYNTQALTGTISASCSGRGVAAVTYPQDGIQNGSPDGLALVNSGGQVVEFLSYEGVFTATTGPAAGMTSTDIGVSENSSPVGQSLQRDAAGAWQAPAAASMGACNGGPPPPPPGNTITFSGRLASDPALPVGFQDQLFATVRDGNGTVVVTTIAWSSETPAVASIDHDGVFTALSEGTASFRATAADGITTNTFSLPTRVAVASGTAVYAGHAEFGEPADGSPSDDLILRHAQYTTSYNPNRGTPNWVSYNLELSHFGPEDRCDCFTFDPALPASVTRYTTADYTGAGAFHGYGIDRGHLTRSFDRTSASLDNAFTYYFTNIVPQAADQNQGPWAIMENFLGDQARLQNKEVYIVAGVAGNKGTIKDQGKIVIPTSTWKVAVIMPRDQGLANVHGIQDLEVIAVIMPNDPGVRNVDWNTYKTTVDAVEALSGYDILALLPDPIEIAVESGTSAPVATVDGPYNSLEGGSVAMSGAGSTDPDGDALTFAWNFGDGGIGAGATVTHTYSQDGAYTVQLIVTDVLGLADTITTSATVANVAPTISALAGATLLPDETYTAAGSFTDPGTDPWNATVNYGNGSGVIALALSGKNFTLARTYQTAGTFTVTVQVGDDDATAVQTATVTVLSQAQGIQNAIDLVNQLQAAGKIGPLFAVALKVQLALAKRWVEQERNVLAVVELRAVLRQLDVFVRAGRINPADAAPLQALLARLIDSLT